MSEISGNYIRFDWAMKRLLRNKANHEVLEGLLESLLGRKYTIVKFLESEGNRQSEDDKFNRVDLLAEDSDGEMFLFEVQNGRELQYYHRMLYGTSKLVTDYIHIGDDYGKVNKIYSINIVYFELGQGKDYVYHGKTEFRGIHDAGDILRLSDMQNKKFFGRNDAGKEASDVFPEYYILRVNDFDKVATTPIDEWMQFLKTTTIADDAKAPGLEKARDCLKVDRMTKKERHAYERHLDALRYQKNTLDTAREEGRVEGREEGRVEGREEGRVEGREEGRVEGREEGRAEGISIGEEKGRAEGDRNRQLSTARNLLAMGLLTAGQIAQATGLSAGEIEGMK